MSADAWRPVRSGDVAGVPEQADAVEFPRGRAEADDHPTRPADATLRRIRRLADECEVTDHNGRQVTVDFHLVAGLEINRSSILFRRARDGLAAKAFRVRLPLAAAPEDVTEREAVMAVAEPIAAMRPPVGGTAVFINADGFPHVIYGKTYVPPSNDGEFPAAAVTDFLAELRPAVQRVVGGGPWRA